MFQNLSLSLIFSFTRRSFCLALAFIVFTQVNFAQNTSATADLTKIELGKTIERELAKGQTHIYEFASSANNYGKFIIEQRGFDLTAKLLGADGKTILEYDSENRFQGEEIVEFITAETGNYRLEISPRFKSLPAGNYQIRFAELRESDAKDKELQEARLLQYKSANLRREGKSGEALSISLKALEILKKNLDVEDLEIARVYNSLGNSYSDDGDYKKAESFHQNAIAIRTKILGEENPTTATSIADLGVTYRLNGESEKAEKSYHRALAIREKVFGKEHPDVARTYHNLGNLNLDNGNFLEAEKLYLQSLAINEKTLEPNNQSIASNLNSLAIVYGELGDYVKSEEMYLRALAIAEKNLSPEHPSIALYLDNLAGIYRDLGDLERAEPMYERALQVREKTLGPEHLIVSVSLNNIGNLYDDKSEHEKAQKFYQRSLEIREKVFKGNDHPWIVQSLYNLGDSYRKGGDLVKAEQYLQRSLEVSEKVFGADHPNASYSIIGLGRFYWIKGNYEKAEQFYLRALAIYDKNYISEHPYKAKILTSLALFYLEKGDILKAIETQEKANNITEKNITANLSLGSEQKKLIYLNTLSEMRDLTLTINLYAKDNAKAKEIALTNILQRKGRVLDSMSNTLSALRSRFNAEDRILLDKLNEANARLALLVLNGQNRVSLEEHQKQIKSLEENRNNLELEISRRAAGFYEDSKTITLAAVRKNIPEDAILIEFAAYDAISLNKPNDKTYNETSVPRYAAYVVGRQGEIQVKDLGEAAEINSAIESFRNALHNSKRQDVKQLARAVDDKIMKPLRELVGDKKQILLSPDGDLNLIPFEALVDEKNLYLVENYAFHYLTSGRDLMRLQTARTNKNKSLVIANPLFGNPESTTVSANPKFNKNQSITATRNLSDTYFAPLDGTIKEADAIKTQFPDWTILSGAKATETEIKQLNAPPILHIATHGFFLENVDKDKFTADSKKTDRNSTSAIETKNPLLRSGLAFAGANERKNGKDDGILTALEASGLNLWGTKLVVLSACDTGLGEVKNGEGVYGLRRAFTLAGTESLIMSLWSVSDYVTRELMRDYYKNLKTGMGRGESLRQVQLAMLKKKDREHPFYWAAFIQSGEWANLEGKR